MIRPDRSRDVFHLFALAMAVVVVATLYVARVVLIPVALAVLFSFLLSPAVALLERLRLPRGLAAVVVVVLALAALSTFGWIVAKQLVSVTEQIPDYKTNIEDKINALRASRSLSLSRASDTVRELRKEFSAEESNTPASTSGAPGNSAGSRSPASNERRKPSTPTANAPTEANPVPVEVIQQTSDPLNALPSLLGPLGTAGIVVVFTFFMLLQREDLRNRFIRLVGWGRLQTMTQALDEAGNRVSRYLLLQSVVNVSYGIVIGGSLYFIGIPNALLWGAIAGTMRFLPYIGPPIGAALPVLLSLAVFNGWSRPLMTIGIFLTLEIIVSNFVEPMLYGAQTGVTSIAILFAALFWTTLWGPIGLLLSTPLTVCLVVMGRYVPQLEFLQLMMGDNPVMAPDARFYQRLLAMDQDEARDILDDDFKGKRLDEVYDGVVLPALGMAEHDRHRDILDEATEKSIFQTTRELLEEHFEKYSPAPETVECGAATCDTIPQDQRKAERASCKVICVPARDEADEIVAMMLVQLLQTEGFSAKALPLGNAAEILEQLMHEKPEIVCISALPPFAVGHARTLYRKLQKGWPDIQVLVGLWTYEGDTTKVATRLGMTGQKIFTALMQTVEHIKTTAAAAAEGSPPAAPAEPREVVKT